MIDWRKFADVLGQGRLRGAWNVEHKDQVSGFPGDVERMRRACCWPGATSSRPRLSQCVFSSSHPGISVHEAPARTATFDGEQAYVLRAGDGREAWVLPSIGANCIALSVPLPVRLPGAPSGAVGSGQKGRTAHLLSTGLGRGPARAPHRIGFPILSPTPAAGGAVPLAG